MPQLVQPQLGHNGSGRSLVLLDVQAIRTLDDGNAVGFRFEQAGLVLGDNVAAPLVVIGLVVGLPVLPHVIQQFIAFVHFGPPGFGLYLN